MIWFVPIVPKFSIIACLASSSVENAMKASPFSPPMMWTPPGGMPSPLKNWRISAALAVHGSPCSRMMTDMVLEREKNRPCLGSFETTRTRVSKQYCYIQYKRDSVTFYIEIIEKSLGPSRDMCRFFLNRCTRLIRRWRLYDGTCPNLLRGDKVPILSHLTVSRDPYSPWTLPRLKTV